MLLNVLKSCQMFSNPSERPLERELAEAGAATASECSLSGELGDYAKGKLKCRRDFCTLSQGFVWIKVLLFNQLAEFWVAYFRVISSFSSQSRAKSRSAAECRRVLTRSSACPAASPGRAVKRDRSFTRDPQWRK